MNDNRNSSGKSESEDLESSDKLDPFAGGPFSKPGPFDQDVIESRAPREEKRSLSEENFIHESRETPKIGRIPLWIWLALLAILMSLIWGGMNWLQSLTNKKVETKPLLEVTNRDFSLFLWQFPSFMRSHAKEKTGYLPGFQFVNKESMDLAKTDDFVAAPPEVLFLYHTWHRLLAGSFIPRAIPSVEFKEFLVQLPEWQPKHWKQAPSQYLQWIESSAYLNAQDLQTLPESILPLQVRQAFQGWKNYFKEGPAINELSPTYLQLDAFLQAHPHYARNYWRNIREIVGHEVAGFSYLKNLSEQNQLEWIVPKEQLASFLKVAVFNAEQALKGL